LLREEDSIGPIGIVPNFINFGALDAEGRELIKPWVSNQNINVTADMLAEMEKRVEDAFFLSFLKVIEENPDMTATAGNADHVTTRHDVDADGRPVAVGMVRRYDYARDRHPRSE